MLPIKQSTIHKIQNNPVAEVRILHLTHTDIPSDNRILKEIVALAEVPGFQLYGIGICQHLGAKDTNALPQAKIISVVLAMRKLRFIPDPIRHFMVAIEMMMRLLLQGLKVRPNVVHCHDTPVLLVGALLKYWFNAQLVYDAHELESNKNGQSPAVAKMTLWVERLAWPSVDHLISVSPSIIDWYKQHLGPKPSSLILNSPYFSPVNGELQGVTKPRYFHEKFGIPAEVKVFLYLGLLVSGRGIDKMLEVFSARNVTSHVVFVGYGGLEEKIQSVKGSMGNIHLHPPVPHEDVVHLSRSADFGLCIIENVSLSDYYSLPNKLFEYAFAGIPVLASDFPDISRVVQQYGLGECCAIDSQEISEVIQRIEARGTTAIFRDLHELGWQSQSLCLQHAYLTLMKL